MPHCDDLACTQVLKWESEAHGAGGRVCTHLQTTNPIAVSDLDPWSNHYSGFPVRNQGGIGSEKGDFLLAHGPSRRHHSHFTEHRTETDPHSWENRGSPKFSHAELGGETGGGGLGRTSPEPGQTGEHFCWHFLH